MSCFLGLKVCDSCYYNIALLYCQSHSDVFFLCFECDAQIHQVNEVAACHHRRLIICSKCQSLLTPVPLKHDSDDDLTSCSTSESTSAANTHKRRRRSFRNRRNRQVIIDQLTSDQFSSSAAITRKSKRSRQVITNPLASNQFSSSSSVVRSTSPMVIYSDSTKIDLKSLTVILENWCENMSLNADTKLMVVQKACRLRWNELRTDISLYISVAAMILRGLKILGFFSGPVWPQNIRLLYKLAEMARVPSGLILDAESMLDEEAKTRKQRKRRQLLQEGWDDEC